MSEAVLLPATPTQGPPDVSAGATRANPTAPPHGLRARSFGILPEESRTEWARHVAEVRAGYTPVDVLEEKLVAAIATAMWHEIRADRTLVETMAEIPPASPAAPTAPTCRSRRTPAPSAPPCAS